TLPGSGHAYAFRLLPPFDGSSGLIVADEADVKRLNASGDVIQTYSITGAKGFFGLNLDPDGKTFWTTSLDNAVLYRFNIATGGADNPVQTISDPDLLASHDRGYEVAAGVCLKGEPSSAVQTPTPMPTPTSCPAQVVTPSEISVKPGESITFAVEVKDCQGR